MEKSEDTIIIAGTVTAADLVEEFANSVTPEEDTLIGGDDPEKEVVPTPRRRASRAQPAEGTEPRPRRASRRRASSNQESTPVEDAEEPPVPSSEETKLALDNLVAQYEEVGTEKAKSAAAVTTNEDIIKAGERELRARQRLSRRRGRGRL